MKRENKIKSTVNDLDTAVEGRLVGFRGGITAGDVVLWTGGLVYDIHGVCVFKRNLSIFSI